MKGNLYINVRPIIIVITMEDLTSLSISGIYSLLILSLTFSFLLAMRVKQLQNKLVSYEGSVEKRVAILKERVELLETSVK